MVLRVVAGWIRLAIWIGLVWTMHTPWRELGGIADEWTRWLERIALSLSLWSGLVVGDLVREAPARRMRLALWPPTILGLIATVAARAAGIEWGPMLVAGTWLAYVAGVDISAVVRRLIDGHSPDADPAVIAVASDAGRAPSSSISERVKATRSSD